MRVEVTFAGDSVGAQHATDQVNDALKRLILVAKETGSVLGDVRITSGQAAESVANARAMKSEVNSLGDAARRTRDDLLSMRLASGGGGGVGGVGLLGAAVGAAIPLVGPVGGAALAGLAALPGLAAAGGAAVGVLALSFSGLSKAISGNRQAFEALDPSAQAFVQTLRSLEGWVDSLKQTAESGLFPGLTAGLHDALTPANAQAITTAIHQMASALGEVGQEFGRSIGSPAFTQGFGVLMQHSATWTAELGDATLHLAGALGKLAVAAIPLTDWLVKAIDDGSRLLDDWTRADAASGDLARSLHGAGQELSIVAGFIGALGGAVFSLARALTPLGNQVLVGLTDALQDLSGWVDRNRQQISDFTTNALHGLEAILTTIVPWLLKMAGAINDVVKATVGWKTAFEVLTGVVLVNAISKVGALRLGLLALGSPEVLAAIAAAGGALIAYNAIKDIGSNPGLNQNAVPASGGGQNFIWKNGKLIKVAGPTYQQQAASAAKQYGVPQGMFLAQINQESGFNPNAKSSAGALGIAQFMPGTAAGYHINPLDPSQALPAAAKMMSQLYAKYHDWALALAAYNAGEGTVDAYLAGKGSLPKETTSYIASIMGAKGTNFLGAGYAETNNTLPQPESPFGPTEPFTATTKADLLPYNLRLAMAQATTTGTVKDDIKAAQDASAWLRANMSSFNGEDLINAYNELGALIQQIKSLQGRPTKPPALATKGSALSGENAASALIKSLGVNVFAATTPGRQAADTQAQMNETLKALADAKTTLTPKIEAIQAEISHGLADKTLTATDLSVLRSRMAAYGQTITTAVQNAKTAVAAQQASFQSIWQTMASDAVDAFNAETDKFVPPAQVLLTQLQDQKTKDDLQYALTQANQQMADALNTVDNQAVVDQIKTTVGKYSLANAVDGVQSAVMGGSSTFMSGGGNSSLLSDLQKQLVANTVPDANAVAAAQKAITDAQLQIQEEGLTETAKTQQDAYNDMRTAQLQVLTQMGQDWATYYNMVGGNINAIKTLWVGALTALDPTAGANLAAGVNPVGQDVGAGPGGGSSTTGPAAAVAAAVAQAAQNAQQVVFNGPASSFQWGGQTWRNGDFGAFVSYLASTGVDYSVWANNHVAAASIFGRNESAGVSLHAAGGIATKPTFITSRDVMGEAGREALLPLDSPTGRAALRDAMGGGGPTNIHIHGNIPDDWIQVQIDKATPRISRNLGQRTAKRLKSHTY